MDEAVSQLVDALSERKIDPSDADDWKGQMLDITAKARSGIETSVSYAARDVDEYLAKALGFFGNSWLTLTMYSADELGGPDKAFSMDAYNLPWLREHIALSNIYPENDSKTPEQLCFQSALPVLMQKARGAGFVNAYPDPDGYRRRVHMVMKHKGTYYGQLVFMPLLDMLGFYMHYISSAKQIIYQCKTNHLPLDFKSFTTGLLKFFHWTLKVFPVVK